MSKSTVLLEHHLKKLKLPTMLREYASVGAVCTQDRSDYPTYLLRLAERELQCTLFYCHRVSYQTPGSTGGTNIGAFP